MDVTNERCNARCNCNTVALQLVTRIRFPFSWKTSGLKVFTLQAFCYANGPSSSRHPLLSQSSLIRCQSRYARFCAEAGTSSHRQVRPSSPATETPGAAEAACSRGSRSGAPRRIISFGLCAEEQAASSFPWPSRAADSGFSCQVTEAREIGRDRGLARLDGCVRMRMASQRVQGKRAVYS